MKNRKHAISIIGVIVLVITVILFTLVTEDRTIFMCIYLGFIIGAEIVFFGGLLFIEYLSQSISQIILRTVWGFTLSAGALESIIVSCIYMGKDIDSLKGFYTWQLIIWGIAFVVLIIGYFTASSVHNSNSKTMNAVTSLTVVIDKLISLSEDIRNEKYAEELKKIAEELRYSDTSTIVPSDDLIQNAVAKIELILIQVADKDENNNEIKDLLAELLVLINKRKQEIRLTKVGGV
ncbi:hypothetical protein [Anaerosporobacter sp.]